MSAKTAAVADPHVVVEELVAAIDERLATAPHGLHVDDLLAQMQKRLGREVPALEAAARRLVTSYDTIARAQGYTQQVANVVRSQAGDLLQIADQEFVEFVQASELAAAEAEVERIELASRDAMAALQAAVESADVDEVLRLRPQVEIVLPQQSETAKVTLLELQITRAQHAAARSRRRKQAAERNVASAEQTRAKAAALLQRAEDDLLAAQLAARVAESAATGVERETSRLAAARDEAAAKAARTQQERVRRLAGLTSTSEVGA